MAPPASVLERIDRAMALEAPAWTGAGRQAAVLVALTGEPRPRIILGRRHRGLRLHPGEIAFPGGKREPTDVSPWATAKREAEEEVGIDPASVRPLGELSPLVTRTGYEVHPCVAGVPGELRLRVDAREFESVFLSRLEIFAERGRFRLLLREDATGSRLVPSYTTEQGAITGVTAAILAQLANVAYDAGLELRRSPEP